MAGSTDSGYSDSTSRVIEIASSNWFYQFISIRQPGSDQAIGGMGVISISQVGMSVAKMPVSQVVLGVHLKSQVPLGGHVVQLRGVYPAPDGISIAESRIRVEGIQFQSSYQCRLCPFRILCPETAFRLPQVRFLVSAHSTA